MKENLRCLAILFSVVLNVAFLGIYLYTAAPRWVGMEQPRGNGLPYQALRLTQSQEKKFDPVRRKFHTRMHEVGSEIKREQLRLLDLLAQPEQDLGSVRAIQERILDLQRGMQDAVISHLIEESAIFTADQRVRFFRILRERIEKTEPASPPWMRPSGDPTPGSGIPSTSGLR